MTVYIVGWESQDGIVIYGIFSTREKAEAYRKSHAQMNLFVESYEVQ